MENKDLNKIYQKVLKTNNRQQEKELVKEIGLKSKDCLDTFKYLLKWIDYNRIKYGKCYIYHSIRQLSKKLGFAKQTITNHINELIGKGLLIRFYAGTELHNFQTAFYAPCGVYTAEEIAEMEKTAKETCEKEKYKRRILKRQRLKEQVKKIVKDFFDNPLKMFRKSKENDKNKQAKQQSQPIANNSISLLAIENIDDRFSALKRIIKSRGGGAKNLTPNFAPETNKGFA